MDCSVTRFKLFLFTGVCSIFLTTACTSLKEDTGYGYTRASDKGPICETALRDEVAFQWGWRPEVRFHHANKSQVSSTRVVVSGKGIAEDRQNPRHFSYRCEVDVQTDRVAEMELNWKDRPVHAKRKGQQLCRDAVKTRVRQTYDNSAQLVFGSSDSQHIFRNIDAITGIANLRGQSGKGQIEYECEFNRRDDRLTRVDYFWINKTSQSLPARTGDAITLCHDSIREKGVKNGASKVRFSPPRVDTNSKHMRFVHGDGKIRIRKDWKNMTYQCHVNVRNGSINRSNYLLITDAIPSTRPSEELVEQCQRAVARKIVDNESELDVNFYAIKFIPENWKHMKRGRERIRGKVKLSGEGLAKAYPFSCTVDIYSGKVTKTTLKY